MEIFKRMWHLKIFIYVHMYIQCIMNKLSLMSNRHIFGEGKLILTIFLVLKEINT